MTRLILLSVALIGFSASANALATYTVPEPSSLGLLGLALIITGILSRRK